MSNMPFRQVHIDFHTSALVPDIGKRFNKEQFQKALKAGHVNSVTLFSKCHHGYFYHPVKNGQMHPNLDFDLLGAQIDACNEIGVRTMIYMSGGTEECTAVTHPGWLARTVEDRPFGSLDFIDKQGFHLLCYNTPYLNKLLAQIAEVLERFDPIGLFIDISSVRNCYCAACRSDIKARGRDIRDIGAVWDNGEIVYKKYVDEVKKLVHGYNPDTSIFHNAGHLTRGRRDLAHYNSHLELESLPTGGWGYDHFPMSASYAMTLGMEYLGMTGKFHTSWGEFGGYKHPNALHYETSLSLAFGAKCSIGDQLHPSGEMDIVTYNMIGDVYGKLKDKEPYCDNVENIADVAILSQEAVKFTVSDLWTKFNGDIGANRIMLEGKYLYHVIDLETEFDGYKAVILPDSIRLDETLKHRLQKYMEQGGKVLASGTSGLWTDKDAFALDFGLDFIGKSEFIPSYMDAGFKLTNSGAVAVMYTGNYDIVLTHAKPVAKKINPYFNRKGDEFCSHKHTPPNFDDTGVGIAVTGNTAYIAWEIFSDYAQSGSLHLKEVVVYLLDYLLGNEKTLTTKLPDKAISTLIRQDQNKRLIHHILFAHTTLRGLDIEIIESIVPLHDVYAEVRIHESVKRVYLAPQLEDIPFSQNDGTISYKVDKVDCHQMVVIEF
jgi:hypothetical protein